MADAWLQAASYAQDRCVRPLLFTSKTRMAFMRNQWLPIGNNMKQHSFYILFTLFLHSFHSFFFFWEVEKSAWAYFRQCQGFVGFPFAGASRPAVRSGVTWEFFLFFLLSDLG